MLPPTKTKTSQEVQEKVNLKLSGHELHEMLSGSQGGNAEMDAGKKSATDSPINSSWTRYFHIWKMMRLGHRITEVFFGSIIL